MATQQEQRRRLRQRQSRTGRAGGGSTSSTPNQGRGSRLRGAATQARNAARDTVGAARDRLKRTASAQATPKGANTGPEARAQARANAQASRASGSAKGGTTGARTGTGARGPAPDVTVDRFKKPPGRFGRVMGRVGKGLRFATSAGPQLALQTALWPSRLGADDTDPGELYEGAEPIDAARAAELEAAGGSMPDMSTGEEAPPPGEEDISWGDGNGRDRLQRDRPRTFGHPGTTIDAARADEPEAAQLQGEVMAPGLPGVPESEQEIIRVQDGSGSGVVRAPAGLRQGGGTFSTMKNVANAAVPVDTQGLHEARLAAIRRGEDVPGVGGASDGETRRERLRREIRQTQGLDQSFTSMMREGLRRRANRDELEQLNALEIQERQAAIDARQGQTMTPQEIQEMQLDAAEEARERRESEQEQGRYNREQAIGSFERAFPDNPQMVDTAMGYLERSNELDFENPEHVRTARDLLEVSQALGRAKAERSGWTSVFAPDNPFSVIADSLSSGAEPPDPDTAQQAMGQILDAVKKVRTDPDRGPIPFDDDDEVISIGGTEVLVGDLPADVRQRMRTLVERMDGGRNAPRGEISPSFRPRLRTSERKQSTAGVRG